jgi:hypothetical protein
MPRQAKQKIDTSGLYLLVREDTRSRDFYHIRCTVVSCDLKENAIFEPADWNASTELKMFRGFQISAQGNNDDTDGLYGFGVSFRDMYEVDLERAENMAHILQLVKKGLDSYEKEYGWPATFGIYVTVIAKAVGIDWFLFSREPTEYNDSPFSVDDRRYGMHKIDRLVSTWKAGKTTTVTS